MGICNERCKLCPSPIEEDRNAIDPGYYSDDESRVEACEASETSDEEELVIKKKKKKKHGEIPTTLRIRTDIRQSRIDNPGDRGSKRLRDVSKPEHSPRRLQSNGRSRGPSFLCPN
jgi:hypothetical protein